MHFSDINPKFSKWLNQSDWILCHLFTDIFLVFFRFLCQLSGGSNGIGANDWFYEGSGTGVLSFCGIILRAGGREWDV